MKDERQQLLQTLLLSLLPANHATVGNGTLMGQFLAAAKIANHTPPATEVDFKTACDDLV